MTLRIPPAPPRTSRAFTLIELLVVIAIIGTLAALIVPTVGAVKRHQYIYNAQGEMAQLETAIERYKDAYGFYPPCSTNALVHQLYFELLGTTNNGVAYLTLDGSAAMPVSPAAIWAAAFGPGVSGFVNCSKTGGGEDSAPAKNFLPGLKPNQISTLTNNLYTNTILVTSVRGPDPDYKPLGAADLNPWRYNSSNPTNNPGSYDLWIQLVIGGKTNLICNWNKQVQINRPLP